MTIEEPQTALEKELAIALATKVLEVALLTKRIKQLEAPKEQACFKNQTAALQKSTVQPQASVWTIRHEKDWEEHLRRNQAVATNIKPAGLV